ncbi:hypothetical protein LTR78_006046 [Recurvomyces mirabilis]|uniref:Glucose-methanol-choline oxidoreductase N-terminal domain-containing protein n=1 Tax=Recurvomyces mirabilis TaxID=574656 RepID=A0AAE1C0Y9_9PEZI|nr:hypothetical protein LTR78_006046 [Recurvomyces mirabilis]KAK5155143.1 hypothetical protein LTS14_006098 [Recurvomyces mirabilis]
MHFTQSVALIVQALLVRSAPTSPLSRRGLTNDASAVAGESSDYAICGGGLTGLTVASKLTEDPNISVLVIEAGEDRHEDPRVNDVRTYGQAFQTELDWNITSAPVVWQNDTSLPLVAGRMLGGSGSLNGASWTKGPSSQYDLLPMLTGDDSWSWKNFNQYMLEAEHFNRPDEDDTGKGADHTPQSHGHEGEVEVSFARGMYDSPQPAALQVSQKVCMLGPDESQNRSSPSTAFAEHQVQERSNSIILTGHRVLNINWKDCDGIIASGVNFQASKNGDIHSATAKREVLLAAGSLQSPQILELSGVGDSDVLAAAGVTLKVAAPGVGKHMPEQTKNSLYYDAKDLALTGTGPPSAIAFPNIHQLLMDDAATMYDTTMANIATHAADLELKGSVVDAAATQAVLEAQVKNLFEDNAPAAEIFFTVFPSEKQIGIDLWNLIVLSRGTCHIKSNDSWDRPTVEPAYFGHPQDLAIQVAASKQSREVY